MEKDKIYRAAMYLRLSKEDGDKPESDSISNQKEYIKAFLKKKEDIRICEERIDDGYSGVNFERPAFQLMLHDIMKGRINCVIVKDLSRFGRNYIETGRYIEKIFPRMGVRFIAINDHYDSAGEQNLSDCLLIPFKNLINDEYAKDISIKIRSNMDIKRRKGDFLGAFAAYGYLKSKENKNKLIIDEYAAKVVQDIFKWKLSGMSGQGIADKLNDYGILSPMEYKENLGLNYLTGFKTNVQAKWTPVTVSRILQNEIYIGVLEQGKEGTPNYKIRKKFTKAKEDWVRVENNHKAIISVPDFITVRHLLEADTRIAPGKKLVYLFSGILKCGDCRHNMIRKSIPYHEKKYIYYICSANKANTGCSSHRISNESLEAAVFYTMKSHIDSLMNLTKVLQINDSLSLQNSDDKNLLTRLRKKQEEIQKYKQLVILLDEDLKEGIVTQEDYNDLRNIYVEKDTYAEEAYNNLLREYQFIMKNGNLKKAFLEELKIYKSLHTLNRSFVVNFINTIKVYEDGRINMKLNYRDEIEVLLGGIYQWQEQAEN